jgi:superfamily I DNA/RNA helicase
LANKYLKLLEAPKPFSGVAKPKEGKKPSGNLLIARTNAGLFDFVAKNIDRCNFAYNGGFEGYQFDIILDVVNLITNDNHHIKDKFIKEFSTIEELDDYATKANDSVAKTRIKISRRYLKRAFDIYDKMLKKMADVTKADYIATTAHKIKGREYNNVVLLDDFINMEDILSIGRIILDVFQKTGKKPNNFSCIVNFEELRLLYMAITRSKNNLTIPFVYKINDEMIDEFWSLVDKGCIEVVR